jgi:hypothetical protein
MASQDYVEELERGYYVAGSRVSLAPVIFALCEDAPPETIYQNFPSSSSGPVYRAIAFYLNPRAESATYLLRLAARWKEPDSRPQGTAREARTGAAASSVRRRCPLKVSSTRLSWLPSPRREESLQATMSPPCLIASANTLAVAEACSEHALANKVCLVSSLVMYGFWGGCPARGHFPFDKPSIGP